MLAGGPVEIGLLSLLPAATVVCWLPSRLLAPTRRAWQWGPPGITLPLAALTLLGLASLEPAVTWRTSVQVIGLGLAWFVYLFMLNERPNLTIPLAVVILVQGSVAAGQFIKQEDLGLVLFAEPALDPTVDGTSILFAQGRPWLRAYGLTPHPNVLGATLSILLLLFAGATNPRRRSHQLLSPIVTGIGLLGLLVSFSRASWLAFAVGLLLFSARSESASRGSWRMHFRNALLVPLLVAPAFVILYHDLVLSRFLNLTTPIELRSLTERWRDIRLALQLIADHPWRGVGIGNELSAVQRLDPNALTVHNVPLLVAGELGLPGLALWLWLTVTGLRVAGTALAPWVALLVNGLFDNSLWLTTSWRSAILFALVLASLSGAQSRAKG